MKQINRWMVWVGLFAAVQALAAADEVVTREQMMADLAGGTGLCVHLGSTDGALEIAAVQNGRTLAQGLAVDEATCTAARTAIEKTGRYGLASVIVYRGDAHLPYRDHLADRLVVSDADTWLKKGLANAELLRVVAPGGRLYLGKKDGTWSRSTKERPAGMADWPTARNQAQGDLISQDTDLRPPFELRWVDGTALGLYAVNATLTSQNGRYVAKTVWDAGNVGQQQVPLLVVRNAFNGLPLWRRPNPDKNMACLVGNLVLVIEPNARNNNNIVVLDAANGAEVTKFPAPAGYFRGWGAVGDLVIIASGERPQKDKVPPTVLTCVEARTGKEVWKCDKGSWPFLIAHDTVYTDGSEICARAAATGQVRWRKPMAETAKAHFTMADAVVVSTTNRLLALTATDGTERWSKTPPVTEPKIMGKGTPWKDPVPWLGNIAWGMMLYDPATGAERGDAPADFGGRCMPTVVTPRYGIACTRPSLGLLGSNNPGERISFFGMDSICLIGCMVANGMMYTGPSFCFCIKGKIEGFPAFGHASLTVEPSAMTAPRPVEPGPALKSPVAGQGADAWWPTYRGDYRRGAATALPAPRQLRLRWERQLATRNSGIIADNWRGRVSIGLTAPVAAEGRVVVADAEAHLVQAVAAADGKPLWSFRAGGRIDTPPTLANGRCVFGCRDGWVYCLRAADGALIWKTRAAPAAQQVIAYGQLESAWPVFGSVAVKDDLVLAAAGRSFGVDGGLPFLALRLADGSTAWVRNRGFINDMPISDGKDFYIGSVLVSNTDPPPAIPGRPIDNLRPKVVGGKLAKPEILVGPRNGLSEAGILLAPPWKLHEGHIRSHGYSFLDTTGMLVAFDSEAILDWNPIAVGWKIDNRKPYATRLTSKPRAAGRTSGRDAWSVDLSPGSRVHGIALTRDAVILCGVGDVMKPDSPGFVRILSREDGRIVTEGPTLTAPNFDPMAVLPGAVAISLADGRLLCLGE